MNSIVKNLFFAEHDEELDPAAARLYRGVAARLNYIAPDRADIAYTVIESARNMNKPRVEDMKKFRKMLVMKVKKQRRFR